MNERIKKQEIAKQKLNQHIKHLKIEMNQKIDKLYDDFYKEFGNKCDICGELPINICDQIGNHWVCKRCMYDKSKRTEIIDIICSEFNVFTKVEEVINFYEADENDVYIGTLEIDGMYGIIEKCEQNVKEMEKRTK